MKEPPKTALSSEPPDDRFIPSCEWQELPEWVGEPLPNGGEFRTSFENNKRFARWDHPAPGPEKILDKRTGVFQNSLASEAQTKHKPSRELECVKGSTCLGEFGTRYVIERGISPEFAIAHGMDETSRELGILNERLGFGFGPDKLAEIITLVWLPVLNGGQNIYLARINGSLCDHSGEILRFLYSKSCRRIPLIPTETFEATKSSKPIIFTESFLKGLTLLHAGGFPIAFNGLWINEVVPENEKDKLNNRVLAREISHFNFYGRCIYFAFDLDQATKRNVRHAVIRAWILLTIQGAKVYQLCWSGAKGIDDYLAAEAGIDRVKQKEVLDSLVASAKPFKEVLIRGPGGDAKLVHAELLKVKMEVTDREALALEASRALGVTKASLLEGSDKERKRSGGDRKILFPDLEPWPESVDGNALLAELVTLYHKHIYLTDDAAITASLWVIWSYLVQEPFNEVSPYLGFTAPDKRCAKTRCLELTKRLTWRGYGVSDLSKAGFFRLIEKYHPTLHIDAPSLFSMGSFGIR
jgi:hypothetical protein